MDQAPPPGARSQTRLRLVAVALVMSGALMGSIGLSAVRRSIELAASQEAAPPPSGRYIASTAPAAPPAAAGGNEARTQDVHSRRDSGEEAVAPPSPPPPAGAPELGMPPTYGSVNLATGFTPDPQVTHVQAGGDIDVASLAVDCAGFVARAPDFRFTYVAGRFPLTLRVASSADTILLINGPDGAWRCDDNGGGGVNPRIQFAAPMSGQYDVWVGLKRAGDLADAQLSLTETEGE